MQKLYTYESSSSAMTAVLYNYVICNMFQVPLYSYCVHGILTCSDGGEGKAGQSSSSTGSSLSLFDTKIERTI